MDTEEDFEADESNSDQESEDEDIPKKRSRTNFLKENTCVICSTSSKNSELTTLKDISSWNTLLEAAKIHNFEPILKLETNESVGPKISYHRSCRSQFTHKKTLLQKQAVVQTLEASSDPKMKISRTSKSNSSRVYDKLCIFCEKSNKYLRNSNSREPLVQASELRFDDKVRTVAINTMDSRMMSIASRDLVAAEAHYHWTCYRNYTRKSNPNVDNNLQSTSVDDNDPLNYIQVENDAYQMLFSHVRSTLFESPRVVTMIELTNTLILYMNELGVTEIKAQTKKHIRRKLETEFEDALQIFPNEQGKLLVVPYSLSVRDLSIELMRIKQDLNTLSDITNPMKMIEKSALQIRTDVKSLQKNTNQEWPPDPSILDSNALLPSSLLIFLKALCTGGIDKVTVSRTERVMNSIAQDCVYAVTGGMLYTQKHVLLPWAVKTLTGNVEIIKMLNRLGHGFFYTKLEEIETALCLQKLEADDISDCSIPSNIHYSVPTTLAFDNIDRREETLSGGGTSHRVNGIAVQPEVATVAKPIPKGTSCLGKQKRRSIPATSTNLPPYIAGERIGPPLMDTPLQNRNDPAKVARTKNLTWTLVRQIDINQQTVPSWTGFNILTRNDVTVTKDTVAYLPTINAPATEMKTVKEILTQASKLRESLHLKKIVCVFDQALYAKASEVIWKHPQDFGTIVLRMGVFHTICNFLGIIGKRFRDAGLRDLAVESEVIAEGSIDNVLDGRHYNRGVRLHKLLYEAILRLAWTGFSQWCSEKNVELNEEETQKLIQQLHDSTNQQTLTTLLEDPHCQHMLQAFENYKQYLRTECGQLAKFWMSYVDMVEILLGLLRSSREGNWELHLYCIREVLPWCFAYDKVNYSRYLSVYYTEMSRLPSDHPDVYAQLSNGGFAVQLGDQNPFGKIPVDQTIEETVNKDTQTAKGTKGFSLKPETVSRYYLTAEFRTTCLKNLRNLTSTHSSFQHHDLGHLRIKRDEEKVQSLIHLMHNEWINPLDESPSSLVSISSGSSAPPNVTDDLLKAREVGEMALKDFLENRIESHNEEFHSRIRKQGLKTFTDINKQSKVKRSSKETVLKADHKLFGHMLLIAQSRKLDMRQVLASPLGSLPWALANVDGTMKKTNKSVLANHLMKNIASAEEVERPSTCIIDGMSLVQKSNGEGKTFSQVSDSLLSSVLHLGTGSDRIDVVFDTYHNMSIKTAERHNRGSDNGVVFSNITGGQRVKQWRRLLSSSTSKTNFIKFILNDWETPKQRMKLGKQILYVTCGDKCFKLNHQESSQVEELSTSQEEADTRMFLHAKHAASEHASIVICSEDTDVLVIALSTNSEISCKLYIHSGNRTRQRLTDIQSVSVTLSERVCKALPGLHCYTGCDTVSAFGGRGKIKGLKLLLNSIEYQEAFTELGKEWTVSEALNDTLEHFTCQLYAATTVKRVNDIRYQLFKAKNGSVESGQMPPCHDSLSMHVLRANYQ